MKLWVVGVGPGDPKLLTVYAVEVLRRVRLVFAPLMGAESESRAYQTALPYLSPECMVVRLVLGEPEIPRIITEAVHKYRPEEAAFLVLGDPGIYGSALKVLREMDNEVFSEIEVIPGISAYQVMGARLVLPLVQGEEILSIVSGTAPEERIKAVFANSDICVVYKAAALFKHGDFGFGSPFLEGWIGEHLATDRERIYPFSHRPPSLPYFSLALFRHPRGT